MYLYFPKRTELFPANVVVTAGWGQFARTSCRSGTKECPSISVFSGNPASSTSVGYKSRMLTGVVHTLPGLIPAPAMMKGVRVELSPYDLGRGRIVYRYK